MNKKIMALFVMAIFLISLVPLAFAEDDNSDDGLEEKEVEDNEVEDDDSDDGLGEIKEVGREIKGKLIGRECEEDKDCPNIKCPGAEAKCEDGECLVTKCEVPIEHIFKQRKIPEEKLKSARTEYEMARIKLESAKLNALNKKAKFIERKERLAACKNDSATCEKIREEVQEHAKEYLIETADKIIAVLDKIKSKTQESEDLTEEEAAEIIADIDERVAALQEAKTTLETSEDKQEIIKAGQLIKQEWNKVRVSAKLHIEKMKNAKLGNIIARAEQLEQRLADITAKLESQGYDVSDLEELTATFSSQIAAAKEKYQIATALFNQAKEENNAELVKQAQEAHKEAEIAIKEAHATLKGVVRSIKAKNSSVLEEEAETE